MNEVDLDSLNPGLALDYLADVPVNISVVLGKTNMLLSNLLKLNKGAVIELDRAVGEPVDIYINDKLLACGEIVLVDNKIGVTITKLIATDKRQQ